MNRAFVLVLALLTLCSACTPEMRGKRLLGKYEKVFATCRKLTEEAKLLPGQHSCTKVASLAVESSLRDTGLEEAKWRTMLTAWLSETGFTPYYVSSSEAAADSALAVLPAAAAAPAESAAPTSTPRTQRAPEKLDAGLLAKPADAGGGKPTEAASGDSADAGASPKKKPAYGVGSKVQVLWGAKWWPATVLQVKDDKYLIHYDGWASSWDEWVTTARMRR